MVHHLVSLFLLCLPPLCVGLPLPLASLTYLAYLGQAFGHSGKSADKGETEDVSKKTNGKFDSSVRSLLVIS